MAINAERNLHARTGLVEILRTGRTFAVTGAGLSVWAGYPTWRQLIGCLAATVREDRGDEVDVDAIVQNNRDPLHCVQRLGRELRSSHTFGSFIRREFGPRQQDPHDVLYRFARLPFRHILTFNLEESMERVHTAMGVVCGSISCVHRPDMALFLREMDTPECTRQVVHLHGKSVDPPDSIALTTDGYDILYRDGFFCNFLWLLATSRRLLFVGFGFKDFDFIAKFREAVRDVRDNGLCHFAIVGLPPDENDQAFRNWLNDTFLIEPIFYPLQLNGNDEKHEAFVELINGLAETIGSAADLPVRALTQLGVEPLPPYVEDLQHAERLGDRFVERVDPGGGDVQG